MWASVFMRHSGANYSGHTGWAFETRQGVSCIGAVENPPGGPVILPSLKGQWFAEVANDQVLSFMARLNPGYESYKKIWVDTPNVNAAYQRTYSWQDKSYLLLLQNCANATYDILRAYGAEIPPYYTGQPQVWYESIPVEQSFLG